MAAAKKALDGAMLIAPAKAAARDSVIPRPAGTREMLDARVAHITKTVASRVFKGGPIVAKDAMNLAVLRAIVQTRMAVMARAIFIPACADIEARHAVVPTIPKASIGYPRDGISEAVMGILLAIKAIKIVNNVVMAIVFELSLMLAPAFISMAPLIIIPPGKGSISAVLPTADPTNASRNPIFLLTEIAFS